MEMLIIIIATRDVGRGEELTIREVVVVVMFVLAAMRRWHTATETLGDLSRTDAVDPSSGGELP